MRWLIASIVLAVLSGCATNSAQQAQQQPLRFKDGLRIMQQGNAQKSAIESFAKFAAAGNTDGLVAAFDPVVRQAMGDAVLKTFLVDKIIPFFGEFQSVDGYENVTRAGFPDGRTGLVHYTYLVTKNNAKKPFVIALINNGSAVYVVNITVNECVKNRHPVSKGRCD